MLEELLGTSEPEYSDFYRERESKFNFFCYSPQKVSVFSVSYIARLMLLD